MKYEIASIPTRYGNTLFRSRLEARWAAFAGLCGWKWRYEPVDLKNWIPDFWFALPCGHSECCLRPAVRCPRCGAETRETFYIPTRWRDARGQQLTRPQYRCLACRNEYPSLISDPDFHHELYAEVKPYYSLEEFKGHPVTLIDAWEIPSPARFGVDPSVTEWTMSHGAGGGSHSVDSWESRWEEHWGEAGSLVQYRSVRFFDDAEKERNTPHED